MYEGGSIRKKSKTASYLGDLMMERVTRDESSHEKSHSLVFRIRRTVSKTNDDSGIKCSSPSTDETSSEEFQENFPQPIKVGIPKALLVREEYGMKLYGRECNSCDGVIKQNEYEDSNIQNDSGVIKDFESPSSGMKLYTSVCNSREDITIQNNEDTNVLNNKTVIEDFATIGSEMKLRGSEYNSREKLTMQNNYKGSNIHDDSAITEDFEACEYNSQENLTMQNNYKGSNIQDDSAIIENFESFTSEMKLYESECNSKKDLTLQNKYENPSVLNVSAVIEDFATISSEIQLSESEYSSREDLTIQNKYEDPNVQNDSTAIEKIASICSEMKLFGNECDSRENLTIQNNYEDTNGLNDNAVIENVAAVSSEMKLFENECDSRENLAIQEMYEDSNVLNDSAVIENVAVMSSEMKLFGNECDSQGNLTIQEMYEDLNVLNDSTVIQNVAAMSSEIKLFANECDSQESLIIQNKSNDPNVLNDSAVIENITSTSSHSIVNVPFKFRKKSRRTFCETEIPNELLRRSRRIVDLRQQKECQQDLSANVLHEQKDSTTSGHTSQTAPSTGVKKRQKRKHIPRVVECKKRKYARRGRPPKASLIADIGLENPVATGSSKGKDGKDTFQSSKDTVWTLIPKELFESDFFKSQVLKVCYKKPWAQSPVVSSHFSPSTIPPPSLGNSNTRIQLKYPSKVINTVSAESQRTPEDTNCKRPTVIYFKKRFDIYSSPQHQKISLQHELKNKAESTKAYNGALHYCKRCPILEDKAVNNCYEFTKGSVNETDSTLSDILSRNLTFSPDVNNSNVHDVENNFNENSIFDFKSTDIFHHSGTSEKSNSVSSFGDEDHDSDIISRAIIVESLRILFSEEAVLQ